MKILIVCLNGMGDVINLFPLINTLDDKFHKLKLGFLLKNDFTSSPIRSFLSLKCDKSFHYLNTKNFNINNFIQLIYEIRCEGYDQVYFATDTNSMKGPLLSYLLGIKNCFGEIKSASQVFKYKYSIISNHFEHRVNSNLRIFSTFDNHKLINTFNTTFNHKEIDFPLLKGSSYILIHPGCNIDEKSRRWDINYYIEIYFYIKSVSKLDVYFIGGPSEIDLVPLIHSKVNIENCLINQLSFEETASLISNCEFIIGNDSGLMHVAACFLRPTINLYSKIDPCRCRPWNTKSLDIESKDFIPGKPNSIPVDTVKYYVRKLLKEIINV